VEDWEFCGDLANSSCQACDAKMNLSWIVDDPTPVVVIIVIVEAILGLFFVATVQKPFLWGMGGAAVVLGLVLLADYLVITDREAVEQTIREGVSALRDNDLERVLTFLSPSAVKTRERAIWAMNLVRFTGIHISDLKIEVNPRTNPPTAEARFFAVFRYEFREKTAEHIYEAYAARFTVLFEKVNNRWLLTDHYEYEAARL